MNKKMFTAKTLEDCLYMAASQLQMKKEDLKYEVIESKKGFFNKKVSISVEIEEAINIIEEKKENKNGTIKVVGGKIVVTNPKEGGKPASIKPSKEFRILVDGKEIKSRTEVIEDSSIELIFDEKIAERRLNISISPDNMKAYMSIKYIPQNIYELKDAEEANELNAEIKVKDQIFPDYYTKDEVLKQLTSSGIRYGVKEEALAKLAEQTEFDNILIAEGIEATESIDDNIEINFNAEENGKEFVEDNKGRIDYKSIGHVESIKKGEILAVRKEGKEGQNGIDVKGGVKKHKPAKKVQLKAGEGCELKDENTIVASIEGKPSYKGNTFSVHQVHIIEKDVELKTGNIDFVGDIVIYGSVKEGMKVTSGHDLIVNKNVESAVIDSKGDLQILGNIINSNVNAGGTDINKLNKLKSLEKLHSTLSELIVTVDHIKKFNLLGKEVHDGEVIKVLIENKFKNLTQICVDYTASVSQEDTFEEKKLSSAIKERLIGFAPLSIKSSDELTFLMEQVELMKAKLSGSLAVPVNVKISYCQDSIINSSGNIIVIGKGEYVSQLTAYENIEFVSPGSLVRGGVIKARNEIKCKHVGSEGGVSTKLIVEAKGNIWVDVAYQNTCFIVGGMEYTLETASKDVHAYLNNEGELVVDKFIL